MSGFITTIVDQAASLLGSPAPLTIGSLILQGHEVPNRISIGGAQAISVHKLPGGNRIIDSMGADDASIGWHGIFVGPDAARRARILDVMRQQGNLHILSFGDYTFRVIITDYQYDYQERGSVISYKIKSEIAPDLVNLIDGRAGLDFAVQADLTSSRDILQEGAAGILTYAQLSDRTSSSRLAVSAAQLSSIASGLDGSAVQVAATATTGSVSVAPAQTSLEADGSAIQCAIQSFTSSGTERYLATTPFASAAALAAATGEAAAIAALVRAGGYVNRASANLVAASAHTSAPLIHA